MHLVHVSGENIIHLNPVICDLLEYVSRDACIDISVVKVLPLLSGRDYHGQLFSTLMTIQFSSHQLDISCRSMFAIFAS